MCYLLSCFCEKKSMDQNTNSVGNVKAPGTKLNQIFEVKEHVQESIHCSQK